MVRREIKKIFKSGPIMQPPREDIWEAPPAPKEIENMVGWATPF